MAEFLHDRKDFSQLLALVATEYRKTRALYSQGQPNFEVVLTRIYQHIALMLLSLAPMEPFGSRANGATGIAA